MNYQKIANFNKDRKVEHQVSDFLDQNFYSELSTRFTNFERATELSDQYAGIDVFMGNGYIDEKVKNTNQPNRIGNYWASIEICQTTRNGDYTYGWFSNPKTKTTHYAYLYNFTDQNNQTSAVLMAWFNKNELKRMIDQQIGFQNMVDDALQMKYARKKIDDKVYYDALGQKLWKLTKSYEGATVLTTTLEDLSNLKHTWFCYITRGNNTKERIRLMNFDQVKAMF